MSRFTPNYMFDSVFSVTPEFLDGIGVKGLIIDIDNTLACSRQEYPSAETAAWIDGLRERGFRICLVSNNNRRRVEAFGQALGCDYIFRAKKPLKAAFLRACSIMGVPRESAAIIGDQIYTDVLGGNSAGLKTILVRPITSRETLFFRLKRLLERPFIRKFEQENAARSRAGGDGE